MKTFLAIALLLAAPLASANLVSRDLLARDDGLLTLDTATGLEWLDVSLTKGLSVNEVLGGAGGWLGAGFHYADFGDLSALFTDGGLKPLSDDAPFGSIGYLYALNGEGSAGFNMAAVLGPTDVFLDTGRLITGGYVAPTPCDTWHSSICDSTDPRYTGSYTYSVRLQASRDSSHIVVSDGPVPLYQEAWGNWLVREAAQPVPEPGTTALMALGLAAIGLTRRKKIGSLWLRSVR